VFFSPVVLAAGLLAATLLHMSRQGLTFMFRQVLVVISCCRGWRVWMAACCVVAC
jgi:hypothetical protein